MRRKMKVSEVIRLTEVAWDKSRRRIDRLARETNPQLIKMRDESIGEERAYGAVLEAIRDGNTISLRIWGES